MPKSNKSNGNKGAMHIRTPVCNTLAVAHKCKDSLPIKVNITIKRKRNETKGTYNYHPKNHSQVEISSSTPLGNSFLT